MTRPSTRLAIIDSGGANIASLRYAVERLGYESDLTTDPARLRAATHVILPGVGAAADCMARLQKANLVDAIRTLRQPLLGICAGMQLLFQSSEEGNVDCLGLLPGRVQRIPERDGLPVPHMGWNQLTLKESSPLFAGISSGDYVYFVHSYAVPLANNIRQHIVATSEYGEAFAAVVQRGNVYGAQFHPERSATAGALLLRNFLSLPQPPAPSL